MKSLLLWLFPCYCVDPVSIMVTWGVLVIFYFCDKLKKSSFERKGMCGFTAGVLVHYGKGGVVAGHWGWWPQRIWRQEGEGECWHPAGSLPPSSLYPVWAPFPVVMLYSFRVGFSSSVKALWLSPCPTHTRMCLLGDSNLVKLRVKPDHCIRHVREKKTSLRHSLY